MVTPGTGFPAASVSVSETVMGLPVVGALGGFATTSAEGLPAVVPGFPAAGLLGVAGADGLLGADGLEPSLPVVPGADEAC
jgi:hypothetical protein